MNKTITCTMLLLFAGVSINATSRPTDSKVGFEVINAEPMHVEIDAKVITESEDSVKYNQQNQNNVSDTKSYAKWNVTENDGIQLTFFKRKQNKESNRLRMEPHYAGFGLGYTRISNSNNNTLNNIEGVSIKADESTEWFINFFDHILPIYRNILGITTGIGMSWHTYRLANNTHLVDVDGFTEVQAAPVGVKYEYSRLKVVHLTLPVMLEWQPTIGNNHKSFLAVGLEGGIKTFASFKVKYTDASGSTIKKVEDKGLNTNPIAINLLVQAGYGNICLFAKSGLVKIFQDGKGPEVRAASLGLMLHF